MGIVLIATHYNYTLFACPEILELPTTWFEGIGSRPVDEVTLLRILRKSCMHLEWEAALPRFLWRR